MKLTKEEINLHSHLILQISNSTVGYFDNVNVLMPKNANDITIEVVNFDFTYNDLLLYLKENDLNVLNTTVHSHNYSQILKPIQFKRDNIKINIFPSMELSNSYYSLYKFEKVQYVLGGNSALLIRKLLPSTTVTLYLEIQKQP
jgi:hypothetical protein